MKLKELREASILSNYPKYAGPQTHASNYTVDGLELTSLEGAPKNINGGFSCRMNLLTSLKYGPEEVTEYYNCRGNKLTSLEGAPKHIPEKFMCYDNNLTSLKGGPESVGGQYLADHNKISSLEGFPKKVGESFYCAHNKLKSLEGIHNYVESIGGSFYLLGNPIKSHVLGLLLIDGLKHIKLDNEKLEGIINKYLTGSRDVFECQQELMDVGLDEYAQL